MLAKCLCNSSLDRGHFMTKGQLYMVEQCQQHGYSKYYDILSSDNKIIGRIRKEWFQLLDDFRSSQIDKILN